MTIASVKAAVEAVLTSVAEKTKQYGSPTLAGLLVFKLKTAASDPPGRWENPRAGKIYQLRAKPPKKTVTIHPTKQFKAVMNARVGGISPRREACRSNG